MRRILLSAFILLSIAGYSQPYLGNPGLTAEFAGPVKIASKDTTFTPTKVGILVFRQSDSSLYVSTSTTAARKWTKMGSSGSIGTLDQVLTNGNSSSSGAILGSLGIGATPISTELVNITGTGTKDVKINSIDDYYITLDNRFWINNVKANGLRQSIEFSGPESGDVISLAQYSVTSDSAAYLNINEYSVGLSARRGLGAVHNTLLDIFPDYINFEVKDSSFLVPFLRQARSTSNRTVMLRNNITTEWEHISIDSIGGNASLSYPYTTSKYLNGYGNFVALNSDSTTEGSTNLYYTTARANLKANLASPTFTGTPQAPTPSAGDSSNKLATTAYVDRLINYYHINDFYGDPTSQSNPLRVKGKADSTAFATLQTTVTTGANYIVRETPSGSVNGSNVTFTLANTPIAGKEMVFRNGLLQDVGGGNDYTISGATITFNTAPLTGDKIRVTYLK